MFFASQVGFKDLQPGRGLMKIGLSSGQFGAGQTGQHLALLDLIADGGPDLDHLTSHLGRDLGLLVAPTSHDAGEGELVGHRTNRRRRDFDLGQFECLLGYQNFAGFPGPTGNHRENRLLFDRGGLTPG